MLVIERSKTQSVFRERFLKLKREKRVTFAEIALGIGMTQPNLTKIVNGNVKLRLETVEKLSKYFGVDQPYLLGNDNDYTKIIKSAIEKNIPSKALEEFIILYADYENSRKR